MSLINKEDLVERIERYIIGCPIYSDKIKSFVKEILEAEIKYFPAIDPVKHSHWIVNKVERYVPITDENGDVDIEICLVDQYECPTCHSTQGNLASGWNFCPHCGSKMESDKNDIN